MTSDPRSEPLPEPLVSLAQRHTRGEVARDVHLASRARVLEARARGGLTRPWGGSAPPVLAGAALVSLVALGGTLALRRAPIAKDDPIVADPRAEPELGSSPPPNADEVVAGLRLRFRSCYTDGLAQDPTMSGKVVIVAKVGAAGDVRSADVASSEGLSPSVIACLVSVVRGAQFAATGRASELRVPISFLSHK